MLYFGSFIPFNNPRTYGNTVFSSYDMCLWTSAAYSSKNLVITNATSFGQSAIASGQFTADMGQPESPGNRRVHYADK